MSASPHQKHFKKVGAVSQQDQLGAMGRPMPRRVAQGEEFSDLRRRMSKSPPSHKRDLAVDGKAVDMKAAGLNTRQPGTGGSKSANPRGRRIT